MNHEDLSLEKLRISERLASLEKSVEMFLIENTREHTEIKNLLGKYGDNIFGNGKPGLTTRMDRMETIAEIRKWVLGFILTALAGLFVNQVWDILFKK